MMDVLSLIWGYKTTALLDVWSIEHVLSGISVGHIVKKRHHTVFRRILGRDHDVHCWHFNLVAVLCVGYAWEAIEHYLETGLLGFRVEYWFQGVEFWGNRLLTDPLMLVVGYVIAKRYPRLILPARITSCIWLFVHVFLFPHSMYLQQFI